MLRRLANRFAPYRIIDSNGTNVPAWTLADALDWLNYCTPDAIIVRGFSVR